MAYERRAGYEQFMILNFNLMKLCFLKFYVMGPTGDQFHGIAHAREKTCNVKPISRDRK